MRAHSQKRSKQFEEKEEERMENLVVQAFRLDIRVFYENNKKIHCNSEVFVTCKFYFEFFSSAFPFLFEYLGKNASNCNAN